MNKQTYTAQAGLSNTITDAANSRPELLNYLILKNYLPNRRIGGIKKRGGSITETISGTLNLPLGMGILQIATGSASLPSELLFLANFAGVNFRKLDAGSWSSVSVDSNCNFSTSKQNQFCQLGEVLIIAGGLPARWNDGAASIERVGYPPPSTAITYSTSAGALSPTIGYTWMFTYYNSVTGKESDWSPISAASGSVAAKQFDLTITTATPDCLADKKRIYRTTDGGSTYYFVADIDIATGSYTDNAADTALGVEAPAEGNNALPPDESFITEVYGSRVWLNNTADPYAIHPSNGYTGNANDIEYFSEREVIRANHFVTGLKAANARLYIFGPRKISYLTGSGPRTWAISDFRDNLGTLFSNSIVSNGEEIVFLAEDGFKSIKDGVVVHISTDIDERIRRLMDGDYNTFVYVSGCWSPAHNMFFFSFSAAQSDGTPWVLSSTSTRAYWQVGSSGVAAAWSLISGSAAENSITRNYIFGYDPKLKIWSTFEFSQVPDFNDGLKAITFLVSPPPNSAISDLRQEKIYLGVDGGTDAGIILTGFREDRTKDDSDNVTALAITQRLAPGEPNAMKRFRFMEIDGEYSDPTAWGGTLQYILDCDDPQFEDYSSKLYDFTGSGDKKVFEEGLGKHIHLLVTDSTDVFGNIPLQSFSLYTNQRKQRETR